MATPGVFTCAELLEITAMAEQMWADSTLSNDVVAHIESARAILTEQTVQMAPLSESDKNNKVKLEWIEMCDLTPVDCDTTCDFTGGDEAGATCVEYEITGCKEVRFTIKDGVFRTSMFNKEQVVAKAFVKAMKALDEHIAKSAISAIDTYVGTNSYTGGIGTVVGTNTTIPASLMNADAFAYLVHTAILNQINNPYMLSGSNFFEANWIADANSARPNEAGNVAKLNTFRKYFDLFNLDALVGKKSYLIDKGAVAIVSQAYYGEAPMPMGMGSSKIRWSVPSANLPNVRYDVYYEAICVDRDNTEHAYTMVARHDTLQNPVNSCTPTQTGILSFECV